jgi:hypothetical protein
MRISLRNKDRIRVALVIIVFYLCMRACTSWIDTTNMPNYFNAIQMMPSKEMNR